MAGETLVTNSVFYADSGWQFRISSRTDIDTTYSCWLNGNRGRAYATIYDTLFTDNNLTIEVAYAYVDGGTFYVSSAVSFEAVNGTASRDLWCADSDARRARWKFNFIPYGGDGKTYVDVAKVATYSAYQASLVTSTQGYKIYKLSSWGYSTSSQQNISLNTGSLLYGGDPIIVD